ncbi:tyrosine-type recombinase/integrase [Riemerella anatipestifer]|uniref:Tyrosine recombinase XerC n=2 Tax=Riemerella anatipestifer TaxID=34085 RepID=A0A1S7DPW8_RIEAN|nr:Tyrosine recombinase XerC [Riemerella anatipestifer]MBO4234778.1 tyrosine-type recombinase/integrase [Riemerella anatipestifer]MDY3344226.1 tyrosine-type recombinase/integrase [Riemerella anatipestifer]MDY3357306.1 tyrosine-type recombinase/integrase [Riemerella anatipestifer]
MSEIFKQKILSQMSNSLNFQQMELLEFVLEQNLKTLIIKNLEEITLDKTPIDLLHSFLSAKKIEGCSEKSLKYYFSTIEALLNNLNKNVCEISTNDLRLYLSDYQNKNNSSKVTIDNIRRIFSSFFSWLEDEDYILKSPVRRIHKVKTAKTIKEILTDEEIEKLRDNSQNIRDLSIVEILSSTGMRVGELVKINIKDVDFQERSCIVTGKGNKQREVYFDARTKIHLLEYINQRKDNNEALFVSHSKPNKRLTINSIETILRKLGKKCNIHKVHPHKFRRTLATMAIDKGMPIEQVQKLLGHTKIDTTMHYAMVNQVNVKMAHRKFIS